MSDTAAILAIAKTQAHSNNHLGTEATTYGKETPATPDVLTAIAEHQAQDPTLHTDGKPALWPEIRSLIETHIRNQPRSLQTHLGPSELGTTCVHCLAAKLAGWPRQNRQAAWLPFIGTSVHAQFEQLFPTLNKQGFDDSGKGVRYETELHVTCGQLHGLYGGYEIGGSIDLYDRWEAATIDWKVVGSTTLRLAKIQGPSQQYQVQASLYGMGLNLADQPIHRSCIYFLPRNGISLNDAIPWEQEWDPQPGRWALARAQLLVNLMDVIEQADGADVRDAWISLLPRAEDHCFDCGSWPDDNPLNDITTSKTPPTVSDRWKQLIPLIQPTYPTTR